MIATDFSLCRETPYAHQRIGVQMLCNKSAFALFDEMGAGKTKQTIDAAQTLHRQGVIDTVIVVAPAPVRAVWFDKELGELAKHLWNANYSTITEFHRKQRSWVWRGKDAPEGMQPLRWIITNYDFIRSELKLKELLTNTGAKTLLVLDESSAIKNHKAIQTKACIKLREKCGRVVLLNGTPIANHLGDLFTQAFIMSPAIFGYRSFFQFRSRYAMMGGFENRQIIGWRDIEDVQKKVAPYVLRRLKVDCLDLPEKLPSVSLTTTLSDEAWDVYKEMRDELIAWLNQQTISVAPQAGVKAMRLAQITSGFLGGLREAVTDFSNETLDPWMDVEDHGAPPSFIPVETPQQNLYEPPPSARSELKIEPGQDLAWISTDKIDTLVDWFGEQLDRDPCFKLLIWSRFRPEVAKIIEVMSKFYPNMPTGEIVGGQNRAYREASLRLLDPRTAPKGPALVVGTPASGSQGLNLTAAHTVLYISNDYSLKTRKQSEDRVHRPGQRNVVSYFDMVAVGPKGQKTIDHVVLKALRKKDDLATWTTSAWVSALREE